MSLDAWPMGVIRTCPECGKEGNGYSFRKYDCESCDECVEKENEVENES